MSKHLVLAVEVPSFFTKDIDIAAERAEFFADSSISDAEILLGHMGQPGLVKLTMEVSGEKDSDIIEVLGDVRSATLEEPSPGLTDDGLREDAWKLQVEQDQVIESGVRRLWHEGVPADEIVELLESEIAEVRRKATKEAQ